MTKNRVTTEGLDHGDDSVVSADAQVVALRDRLDGLPLLGRRDGALVEDGQTLRWDVPRQTADGRWAVECPPFDAGGVAAPEWPTPPAL
jgi:hypothetical protein